MKLQIKKEVLLWGLIISPIIYLFSTWDNIPDSIPTHFNIKGVADKWGNKNILIGLISLLPILMYIILVAAIYIDPKKMISQMGEKFYIVRLICTGMIAIIFMSYIYALVNGFSTNLPVYINFIIGILFLLLGNYFNSLKPNYFFGFRTPWALEDDVNWRKTHQFGSRLWVLGGIILILINLSDIFVRATSIVSYGLIIILITAPIFYSYNVYKNQSHNEKT